MKEARNAVKDNLRSQLGYEKEIVKTTGGSGGGSDRGLTAGQMLEYQAKQPIFGDVIKDVRGYKGKNVVDVRNAAISIGKSGDVQNITEIGYSPRLKSLYLKYDNYTGVKDEFDFASGKKMNTVEVKEGDPSFSSILRQLGVDKNQLQSLRSGSSNISGSKTYSSIQEKAIAKAIKDNPGATRQEIIKALNL